MNAQTYQSEILKQIASKIALPATIADSAIGYCNAGIYNGLPLGVCVDSNKVVTHIGYKLFPQNIKTKYPSVVYNFIERYLLELDCNTGEVLLRRKLIDDKVVVMEGSLDNKRKINPETLFSISINDDKFFQVTWTNDDLTLLSLAFPCQYELLLGMPKVEIEKRFKEIILGCVEDTTTVDNGEIVQQDSVLYRSNPLKHYYLESCNTACYYLKDSIGYKPLFSPDYKWESAANLFQGVIKDQEYRLYIEQNLYGFETSAFIIPLNKWLNYCKANKLTVYFGIEEEHQDGLKALLIAQSQNLGFNHMLSIIIPYNFVNKRNTALKATLNAFIPTQNVKDLYQQYNPNQKREL